MTAAPALDLTTAHKVVYCIPLWLRDAQIARNIRTVADRVEAVSTLRSDPIAVVGFGPSLVTTWEEIRNFRWIITCSGAHRFLLERGIVPTWHVDVDPRPHKVSILGIPHPEVGYLMASCVHPTMLEHLAGYRVKLWHIFDADDSGIRLLPRGEWAITGGPDAGMRAMVMARFLGFRDLHIFGMDGCAGPADTSHAAPHPNAPERYLPCEYEGHTYQTTPALLECAKSVWHELDMLKDVTATFHGEGLIQAMAKRYVRTPVQKAILAVVRPELISAQLRDLNAQLHADCLEYGVGAGKRAPLVRKLAESLKTKDILDYGCGKGTLGHEIPWAIAEYDPAIPGKDALPKPAEFVVCLDVLEHVEPERLPFVLEDLRRCVQRMGYFVIHTGPAAKHYADGRNTHLIQRGEDWWVPMLARFFGVTWAKQVGVELHVLVSPLTTREPTTVTAAVET